ncbi:GNAT family N-acetyltransferase [Dermacoccus nishinomiyaensis]|uniref:GNAT family N-acetyltransferase n=1 Tax=Dermacoccus nishinomiyaensis TaxID=1274 RepID=UPI0010AC80F1|nr:GNAT family protein [Dermacoccus nishinomiyaensis]TJZ94925.1 GNAT family N-acetyltransferase [Dermacoccus nishinomiyaensis]
MEHDIVLTHRAITLRPLRTQDAPEFRALVDTDSWAGMASPLPATDKAMADHLASIIAASAAYAFAVEQDGKLVGRTTFSEIKPNVRVDIGNTIYARAVWGSVVNPTAKLLLMEYAFDTLNVHRVALRCDSRNTRSHGAIARLGAKYEGTLRNYRPAADGRDC